MRDARAKDSRIHRDISVGNIILVKEPGQDIRRGYLIDWEASNSIDAAGESLQPGRAVRVFDIPPTSFRMLIALSGDLAFHVVADARHIARE